MILVLVVLMLVECSVYGPVANGCLMVPMHVSYESDVLYMRF